MMKVAILWICLALAINQSLVVSQGFITKATNALFNAPLNFLPDTSSIPIVSAVANTANLPLAPSVGVGFPLGATLAAIKDLTFAIAQSDHLMIGMKLVEIVRAMLTLIPFPWAKTIDSLLEMLHGLFETLHSILKQGTIKPMQGALVGAPVMQGTSAPAVPMLQNGYLSKGMRIAAAIPGMLI